AHTGAPLVIEGAGGVMSPLTDDKTVLDLIAALGGPTILVTGTYLGAISHTLTALEALRRRDVVLPCVIVNESAADNVNLEETVRSLRAQAPQETFAPVARNARLPESIVDLI